MFILIKFQHLSFARLEEVDRQMFKREVGSVKSNFGEFVGNKIIRYNIVNLASAAARKTE